MILIVITSDGRTVSKSESGSRVPSITSMSISSKSSPSITTVKLVENMPAKLNGMVISVSCSMKSWPNVAVVADVRVNWNTENLFSGSVMLAMMNIDTSVVSPESPSRTDSEVFITVNVTPSPAGRRVNYCIMHYFSEYFLPLPFEFPPGVPNTEQNYVVYAMHNMRSKFILYIPVLLAPKSYGCR